MGFHIAKIKDAKLGAYIGSNTICRAADKGAFDSPVGEELEKYVHENENIVAVVNKEGIEKCLTVLKTETIPGRDVQLLITEIETNYNDGFMIVY